MRDAAHLGLVLTVRVGSLDHVLYLLLGVVVAQCPQDPTQLVTGDPTVMVLVKQVKSLLHV